MSQKAATELAQYLEELAEKLESHNNGAKFSDHWSWQASTLTTSDLSYVARKIAERIEAIEWSESDTDTTSVLGMVFKTRLKPADSGRLATT